MTLACYGIFLICFSTPPRKLPVCHCSTDPEISLTIACRREFSVATTPTPGLNGFLLPGFVVCRSVRLLGRFSDFLIYIVARQKGWGQGPEVTEWGDCTVNIRRRGNEARRDRTHPVRTTSPRPSLSCAHLVLSTPIPL